MTASGTAVDLDGLTARLRTAPGREDCLTHLEVLPARDAREAAWPSWLDDRVREAVQGVGVPTPWAH